MKLLRICALAVLAACMPLVAFADSNVNFLNSGGTITAMGGNSLTLTGSSLAGISNLGMGYNCPPPACNGTVSFTTGATLSSGTLTTSAIFGPGGNFNVTSNTGPGGGFVFSGAFSEASWTKGGTAANPFWTFVGTVMDGTLTLDGGTVFTGINGATVQLTSVGGGPVVINGHNTWTNSGGSTNFPSPVPEPGTLTLLGTGLIGVGLLTRRRILRRTGHVSLSIE